MSIAAAAVPSARRGRYFNAAPVVIIAAMAMTSLACNRWAGIRWFPTLPVLLAIPMALFAMAATSRLLMRSEAIAETALYLGLWTVFSVFATQLTYLANAVGLPLQDKLLADADAALGFHWMSWARIIGAHRWLADGQALAYQSYLWQPIASIPLFAICGPPDRNRELLTAMLLGSIMTIAVSAFVPAIGPAAAFGYNSASEDVIRALRSGSGVSVGYLGIVSFPSFHTVMAVLFAWAHRRNGWTCPLFLFVNGLMLLSIPYSGDHYLSDMIGGAATAAAAIAATRLLYRGLDRRSVEAGCQPGCGQGQAIAPNRSEAIGRPAASPIDPREGPRTPGGAAQSSFRSRL